MSKSPVVRIPDLPLGGGDGQMLRWEASTNKWEATGDIVVGDSNLLFSTSGSFIFTTNNTPGMILNSSSPRMEFQTSGVRTGRIASTFAGLEVRAETSNKDLILKSDVSKVVIGDTNGTESFDHWAYFLNTGEIGIHTDNPRWNLEVAGPSPSAFASSSKGQMAVSIADTNLDDFAALDFTSNTQAAPVARIATQLTASGSKLLFGTSSDYSLGVTNSALTIDPTGNVGIGTTTPAGKLHVTTEGEQAAGALWGKGALVVGGSKASEGGLGFSFGLTNGANLISVTPAQAWHPLTISASDIKFNYSGTLEAMRVNTSGNLLVGTTTGGNAKIRTVAPSGVIAAQFYRQEAVAAADVVNYRSDFNGANTECARLRVDGTLSTASDASLKDSVETLTRGLSTVMALKPVSFRWINSSCNDIGFIAQEVEPLIPEATDKNDDGLMTLAKDKIIPVLVKAIQELAAKVEQLEAPSASGAV